MNVNEYFRETQRFAIDWMWILVLLLGCTCLFLYGVIKQVIFEIPWGTEPASDTALLACLGFLLLFTLLFACIRLETRIKEDGIYVKYFPFQLTYKKFLWTDISKSYVKQYNPIQSGVQGGWGYSRNRYTVSGNIGLQIEFVSGRRILIGTKKSKDITETLTLLQKIKK